EPVDFKLPAHQDAASWTLVFDTRDAVPTGGRRFRVGRGYKMIPRSVAVLMIPRPAATTRRAQAQSALSQPAPSEPEQSEPGRSETEQVEPEQAEETEEEQVQIEEI